MAGDGLWFYLSCFKLGGIEEKYINTHLTKELG
jgi:hypothetical protein